MGGMYSTLGANVAGGTGAPGGMRQFVSFVSGVPPILSWEYWGPPLGMFGTILAALLLTTIGSCY